MKHKRATDYGGRTPRGFWIESAFIALIALAFIAALLAMVAYARAQPVSSTDIRVVDGDRIARYLSRLSSMDSASSNLDAEGRRYGLVTVVIVSHDCVVTEARVAG